MEIDLEDQLNSVERLALDEKAARIANQYGVEVPNSKEFKIQYRQNTSATKPLLVGAGAGGAIGALFGAFTAFSGLTDGVQVGKNDKSLAFAASGAFVALGAVIGAAVNYFERGNNNDYTKYLNKLEKDLRQKSIKPDAIREQRENAGQRSI